MVEMNPTMLDPNDDDLDIDDKNAEQKTDESSESDEHEGDQTSQKPTLDETVEKGSILEGKVVQTADTEAYVDLDWKTEGVLPYDKLREGGISEGDETTVKVIEMNHDQEAPLLSENEAHEDLVWRQIRHVHDTDQSINGEIFKKIKGGFLVKVFDDFTAFMPLSHLSLSRKENFDRFIDEEYQMKVLEFDREEDNVVLSRREHLEDERRKNQDEFFSTHDEGDWITGTVKNIVNFGAFINIGAVDGLLHISDVSWGEVREVEDYFSTDDEIEVQILSMDRDESKVSLGYKQKYPDPWEKIDETYEVDNVTTGEIVDVCNDGVFVRLEDHVEGKIGESELAWTESWEHPEDQFQEGEKIEVKILEIDHDNRTMTLSHKQTKNNPWKILKDRFPKDTVLQAPVVDIKEDHINVQLLDNVKGMIKRSDISWDDTENTDLYEAFSIGEKVKCKVLTLDPDEQRVELGMKQTMPDPWVKKARKYEKGSTHTGTVTSILQFGAFIELEDDFEGLVHVSEMGEGKRVNPHEIVSEGEKVGVKVLDINEDEHKIDLSINGYEEEQRRQEMEEYMDEDDEGESDMTMGDLLGDDLDSYMKD